jgi:hypothetical protein
MTSLRMFSRFKALHVAIISLLSINLSAQSWMPLGPDDFNNQLTNFTTSTAGIPTGDLTKLTLSKAGIPYVLFNDASQSFNAIVKSYVNGLWQPVGGILSTALVNGDICVDTSGLPCIAIRDGNNGQKLTVKRFDGTTWNLVGTAGFSDGQISAATISIDKGNNIYVAYSDAFYVNKVVVKKWDGVSWTNVGTPGFSTGAINSLALGLDKLNIPYVAYGDQSISGKSVVRRFQNANWDTVGLAGFSAGVATIGNICIDTTGKIWVLYKDASLSGKLVVAAFSSTAWGYVGGAGFTSNNPSSYEMSVTPNGVPYVFYQDPNSGTSGSVKTWDGTQWQYLGNIGFTVGTPSAINIATDTAGTVMLAYYDAVLARRSVQSLNPEGHWATVGFGFTEGQAVELDMELDTSGIPYAMYADGAHGYKLSVKRYINGSWQYVGAPGIVPANSMLSPSLAITSNNNIYLSYKEHITADSIVVRQLSGTNWNVVGKVSCASGSRSILRTDSLNNIYLYYVTPIPNEHTVTKFDGSTWTAYPPTSAIIPLFAYINLSVSKSGTPHLAYADGGMVVVKYDNNSWSTVGSPFGGTWGNPLQYSMIFGANDTAYLAYVELGPSTNSNNKLKIKKLSGSTWTDYLSPVDTGNIGYPSFIFRNNRPALAYTNGNRGVGFFVKGYGSAAPSWSLIGGNSSVSRRSCYGINLQAHGDSLYVVYTDNQDAFAKAFNILGSPLSIESTSLRAVNKNGDWYLSWNVQDPNTVDHFEIQDLRNTITTVAVVKADSPKEEYMYDARELAKNSPYRVKLVRTNGNINYTNVVVIPYLDKTQVTLSPNPVEEVLNVSLTGSDAGKGNITITNMLGQVMCSSEFEQRTGGQSLRLNLSDLNTGIYSCVITTQTQRFSLKIIKK